MMEPSARHPVERLATKAYSGEAGQRGYCDFDIDGLYDLSFLLARNERDAERVMLSTLREAVGNAAGTAGPQWDPRTQLVRNYLRQSCTFSGRMSRLTSCLNACREKRLLAAASRFEAGLDKLLPQDRACLILRERMRLSVWEIAQITGLTLERVHRALFSAREQLLTSVCDE